MKIVLCRSDEGYSVSVPSLPGCWSQGNTEAEAIDNIKTAVQEYLSIKDDLARSRPSSVREALASPPDRLRRWSC